MGNITLDTRVNGLPITSIWFNALRNVLINTLLPRNSSGIVEDSAGAIGTDALRFGNLRVSNDGSINIGNSKMYESAGEIFIKDETSAIHNVTDKLKDIASMITLTGLVENSVDLGIFSGQVIKDNVNIKTALQNLELTSWPEVFQNFSDNTLRISTFAAGNPWVDTNTFTIKIPRSGALILVDSDVASYNTSTLTWAAGNGDFTIRDSSSNILTTLTTGKETSAGTNVPSPPATTSNYSRTTRHIFISGSEGSTFDIKVSAKNRTLSSGFEFHIKNVKVRVIGF